ncbi:MAG: FecR domain-containing protein [Betaproteobacteria bacterium]
MTRGLIFLGLVVGATGAGQALAQTAGVIQFAAGAVKVVAPGGAEREARKGVAVNVGDTLTTPAGGLAQLKMGDGAIVVVQPESRLTVAEFHYAGVEDGNEKVRYRLEHGGFRAVTGAIGRTHKKNYLIETPIAHMGVRGTDHESYYFPATGPVSGDGVKPGAFNKVNTGRTYLRTQAGEVEIEPNQVGFVASAGEVPTILPSVPGFFNRSIAPRQARPAGDSRGEPVRAAEVRQDVKTADGESLVRGRGKPMTQGSGDGKLYGFSVGQGATFGRSGNGMMLVANGAEFENDVTDYMGSGVNWGTWEGGAPSVNGQMTSGGVHVISTTNPTDLSKLPPAVAMASFNYTHAGGPAPTNGLGGVGKIDALTVGVNFTTQQITNYNLQATAIGTWNVNGSGSIAAFTGTSGIGLNGTCSNCAGGSMGQAVGTAHGGFVGAAAEGMITTFGLTSSGNSISGAAYLTR